MTIRRIFFLGAAVAIISGCVLATHPVIAADTAGSNAATGTFTPELNFPGFTGPQTSDNMLLSRYIRALFVYFIWTVGILATFMTVYAGVRWISAAGNASRIQDARETLNNAIIGVIIALTSVVLLNTISPRLTNLSVSQLTHITKGELVFNGACVEDLTCPSGFTQAMAGVCSNLPGNGAWGYVNPGQLYCGDQDTPTRNLCCQNDSNKSNCVGIVGTTGQTVSGTCNLTPIRPSTLCGDQTTCGTVRSSDNACIGTYCKNNGVCYLQDDDTGKCFPGNDQSDFTDRGCSASLTFSSSQACGAYTTPTSGPVFGSQDCPGTQNCILPSPEVSLKDPNSPAAGVTCKFYPTTCAP
ncbi:MAG: hypothetical protein HY975_03295 [Candidatus Kerfeldbacteria bacterium]|nr:hypothetical protein [Candidatus Kerfeldbacteria bacterium]